MNVRPRLVTALLTVNTSSAARLRHGRICTTFRLVPGPY